MNNQHQEYSNSVAIQHNEQVAEERQQWANRHIEIGDLDNCEEE